MSRKQQFEGSPFEKISVPTATVMVPAADGAAIPMRVFGTSGPTVILIHGWSCNQNFWREQVAPLSRRFRVATLDLPGHGQAGTSRPSGWSMAGFGVDVVAVADWLGAERVALVGHSMGGAVALEAALLLGSRCRMLVGVDTFNEAAFYAGRPAAEIAARRSVFEADFAGTMAGMVKAITAEGIDRAIVDWIGAAMSASDPAAALGILEALLAWDIRESWPKLLSPVVTINSAMLARRNALIDLPGLDIRLMEGVGHFPMMEDPCLFNALAENLLG